MKLTRLQFYYRGRMINLPLSLNLRFNLALHPWYEPMDRLVNEAWSKNVIVAMPIVGETTIYDKYIPTKLWWEEYMSNEGLIVTE